MNNPDYIQVGGIFARPGEKRSGLLRVVTPAGEVEIPVTVVHGVREGPRVALIAGVHGSEYAGIAAAMQVLQELDPGTLSGAVLGVPVAGVPAFRDRTSYVSPIDGENLARLFPGNPQGSPTERMAHVIQRQIVDQADHVLELHGGDMVEWLIPFCMYSHTSNPEIDRRSMELTQSYGLPILQIPSWDGRFSHEGGLYSTACEMGKPSVLAEAGGQGLADPEAVNVHVQGIKGVLACLGMLPGPGPQREPQPVTSRHVPMRAPMTGVLRTHTLPGSMVHEGNLVAEITDYFGTVLCPVHAAISGTVLYIVTSLSVRAGEPMLSIADFEAGY